LKHAAEKVVSAYATLDTPLGALLLGGDGSDVLLIGFPEGPNAVSPREGWVYDPGLYREARRQLADYFTGRRHGFDFPMRMIGTAFQKMVWEALLAIPFGVTRTYGAIAAEIGRPSAVRAVGAANGANPLPIVVPCHRLVSSTGGLIKFGGGLAAKRFLLDLENQARTS
jgi:methylated-DNA-[protein]-cysteine S-methyltransferase